AAPAHRRGTGARDSARARDPRSTRGAPGLQVLQRGKASPAQLRPRYWQTPGGRSSSILELPSEGPPQGGVTGVKLGRHRGLRTLALCQGVQLFVQRKKRRANKRPVELARGTATGVAMRCGEIPIFAQQYGSFGEGIGH